jgi:hypothetical protein
MNGVLEKNDLFREVCPCSPLCDLTDCHSEFKWVNVKISSRLVILLKLFCDIYFGDYGTCHHSTQMNVFSGEGIVLSSPFSWAATSLIKYVSLSKYAPQNQFHHIL